MEENVLAHIADGKLLKKGFLLRIKNEFLRETHIFYLIPNFIKKIQTAFFELDKMLRKQIEDYLLRSFTRNEIIDGSSFLIDSEDSEKENSEINLFSHSSKKKFNSTQINESNLFSILESRALSLLRQCVEFDTKNFSTFLF